MVDEGGEHHIQNCIEILNRKVHDARSAVRTTVDPLTTKQGDTKAEKEIKRAKKGERSKELSLVRNENMETIRSTLEKHSRRQALESIVPRTGKEKGGKKNMLKNKMKLAIRTFAWGKRNEEQNG